MIENVQQTAGALVDCFATAREPERARRVAQAAWQRCRDLYAAPPEHRDPALGQTENKWLKLFHQAGLPLEDMARVFLARLEPGSEQSLEDQGVVFNIRAWTGDVQTLIPDWLAWVQTCIDREAWQTIEQFRNPVGMVFYYTRQPDMLIQFSQTTWERLGAAPGKEAETLRSNWDYMRFHVWSYLKAGDLSAAEELTNRQWFSVI